MSPTVGACDLLDKFPLYLILTDFIREDLTESEEADLVTTLLRRGWIDTNVAAKELQAYAQLEFDFNAE